MPRLHKTITINATPEKIFKTLDDPDSMKLYVPAVTQVSDVKQSEGRVGDTWRVTYALMGVHFDIAFTRSEHVPNSTIANKFDGGMSGIMSYTLKPLADATEVSFDVDYQIAGGVLGKAVNALLLERMNEKNSERNLENLKMALEMK